MSGHKLSRRYSAASPQGLLSVALYQAISGGSELASSWLAANLAELVPSHITQHGLSEHFC
jgi:hypothetical protein